MQIINTTQVSDTSLLIGILAAIIMGMMISIFLDIFIVLILEICHVKGTKTLVKTIIILSFIACSVGTFFISIWPEVNNKYNLYTATIDYDTPIGEVVEKYDIRSTPTKYQDYYILTDKED